MFRPLLMLMMLAATGSAAAAAPEKFIVYSEFQVFADPVGPETYRALNEYYIEHGTCRASVLYRRGKGYDYYIWDNERTKFWVDECLALGTFNVFGLGDDTETGRGRLFTTEGVNPALADVLFGTIEYAHRRGLLVAVEPAALPNVRDREHFEKWFAAWLGPDVPKARRADIVKLSVEWFGGGRKELPKNMVEELDAFIQAAKKVNPDVLVYFDSIGGRWYEPQALHRWLLSAYPGTMVSIYRHTPNVDSFREMGARNMMVQINPCEAGRGTGCHLFLYFDATVNSLKEVVAKRVCYLSLAGANYAYNRRDFDLFLEVIRPHLRLAADMNSLRKSIVPDEIGRPATKEEALTDYSREGKPGTGIVK
jgi:hypothetical protein